MRMIDTSFYSQPLDLELMTDEIHVWYASLDQPVATFQRLTQTLSMNERTRAKRFHFKQDKKRFIVGRGILRTILGCYLRIEPSRLQFCYGENGKPALANTLGKGAIHFNLSHSDGLALYFFSQDREIGVDIERVHDIDDIEQIARCFFSVRENVMFRALPKSKKKEAFFNCWTRKEAYIKAIGDGLTCPLNQFDVTLTPGEPACLLEIKGDKQVASRWSICELSPAPGYKAALAAKARGLKLSYRQWG